MQIGTWYEQRFSDQVLYFLPLADQKNGGFAGTLVTVDLFRPRARPKAKKSSVRSGPYGSAAHWSVLWREARAVPAAVVDAAGEATGSRRDRAAPSRRRAPRPFAKKPGKHGTLYLFEIKYRDEGDPASPTFEQKEWAYDPEHAEDKFWDAPDSDGWRILSITKVREP